VDRLIHPDLRVLFPQYKEVQPEDVRRRLDAFASNPYASVDHARSPHLGDPARSSNKQVGHFIERIHGDLYRPMGFKPVEGEYKVAVLTDADMLRPESANAFLKLLEEPSPRTVFILTTCRVERVLPTIVSRCQRVQFGLLDADAIAARLVRESVVDSDMAGFIARLSDGSMSRAYELASQDDLSSMRSMVVDLFRILWRHDHDALLDTAGTVASWGREKVKHLLRIMLSWLRDLIVYRSSSAVELIVNIDQASTIENFSNGVPDADLDAMVRLAEESIILVSRNVNLALLLVVLFTNLEDALVGRCADTMYMPLDREFLASTEGVAT